MMREMRGGDMWHGRALSSGESRIPCFFTFFLVWSACRDTGRVSLRESRIPCFFKSFLVWSACRDTGRVSLRDDADMFSVLRARKVPYLRTHGDAKKNALGVSENKKKAETNSQALGE
ncbi:hypothetical protein V5799_009559 [Amblyomma americanum]|uniref:Uncharacterized protein n=1 Tax=Amblyomma americanum TaxID=6943 RepID=A0AAQ4FBC8_AMBAM